jgi:hemerythrin-like domain-containing protein
MTIQHTVLSALLHDIASLCDALTALSRDLDDWTNSDGRSPKQPSIQSLLEQFREIDMSHHIYSGRCLFARIGQRCPPLLPVLARMEQEHAQLVPMYLELVDELDKMPLIASPEDAVLVRQIKRFIDVVLGHLGVEENYILSVATDFLTAQDWIDMGPVQGRYDP